MIRQDSKESIFPPLWIVFLFVIVFCGWLLYELKEIAVLLVVGYCIAYVMEPGLCALERRKISRPVGVFVILSSIVILVLVLALTALPTIFREYQKLADNFPHYVQLAKDKIGPLIVSLKAYLPAHFADKGSSLLDLAPSIGTDTINKILSGIVGALLKGYSITLTIVNLALLPFIVYYLAVDFHALHQHACLLFPPHQREVLTRVVKEIDSYISAFLRGQLIVGAILFLLYAAGLGLIGVELWFLLAIISGFGNMIPYLGLMVGIVLSSIMALVSFGDFWHLFWVWIVFIVVQFVEGTFITPKILGDKVGLSPLAVILAIVAGGTLFGLLGIFLAVPGAAALRVLMRHFHAWLVKR